MGTRSMNVTTLAKHRTTSAQCGHMGDEQYFI